ncbi:MAG: phospho-sugar mutase [Ruminococcaceae bacterium]|nr:phospho-sugar mutase [Oscillospiraceae bacterium]
MLYASVYENWLKNTLHNKELHDELLSVNGNSEQITDRFYKELDFGTAGLRGVLGAGTNRMNIYTVGRATEALAKYVLSVSQKPSVAIAYDSRINSTLFAETAAAILSANGVKVYIYKELMPTPMLSFAVRELKCDAGIVITASHNPAQYNGYKVYGSDGCQLGPDAAKNIMDMMQSIDCFNDVKFADFNAELEAGKIEYIENAVIESYLAAVKKQSVNADSLDMSDFSVIYTPIHGTGNKPVRAILDRIGVKNVIIVKEQELPDGNFPTAPYPNPEIRQPFELALDLAKSNNPDILLATDPDADRVGIAVKNGDDFTLMTGNDIGALLLNYILECRTANGTLPNNPVAVKTIVTTELCQKIADAYGCELINVLTGFKYIGEQIAILEEKGEEDRYVLGFEESYGYLSGGYVRDKDAVVASMLICEMAAYYKTKGLTLVDKLNELFEKYGYYINRQRSFAFEGQSGMAKMGEIMGKLRTDAPTTFAGSKVAFVEDYLASKRIDMVTGKESEITLPKSNVVVFGLQNNCKVIFRPSGTEPKIKVYIGAVDTSLSAAEHSIELIAADAAKLMK